MKKYILLSLLAVLAVAVCVSCDLVEDDPAVTTDVAHTPTENVTDLGIDEPTGSDTEPSLTETKVIPADTLEPVVFEDEALNSEVECLRAEGYDMEQLTFRDVALGGDFICITFLNHRYFTHGDVLTFTVDDLTADGIAVDMRQEFRYQATVTLFQGTTETQVWKSTEASDRCSFALFIHDGIASGVYFLQLEYGDETAVICPVIIYKDPTPLPTAPAVYEDEALNAVINSLREEGHDMEKLVWREGEQGETFNAYHAVLNGRAFRSGDTVELSLPVFMGNGKSYYDPPFDDLPTRVTWFGTMNGSFTQQDTTLFTYTIPEDAAPSIHWICVYAEGEDVILIGPIVVY